MGSGNGSHGHASRSRIQRGPRSRSGCQTCLARHVKCDERSGGCANCERLALSCSNLADQAITQVQPSAKRTYRSCSSCRASKAKCSGNRPACSRCQRKRLKCTYGGRAEPGWIKAINEAGSSAPRFEIRGLEFRQSPGSADSQPAAVGHGSGPAEGSNLSESVEQDPPQSHLPSW